MDTRLPVRGQGYILDIDSTVVECFGEQEGSLCGYNPLRRGGPTHHPLLAGLAESRIILHAWLRGGNTASGNNAVAFLQECLALAEDWVKLRLLRADKGIFDNRILSLLESAGLPYLVKSRFTKLVKLAAQQVGGWMPIGSGIEVAEARIKFLRWDTERRLVLIRHRVPEREKPQGKRLFACEEHRYQAIVTSLTPGEMDAANVYRNYLPRGEFENRIKELKEGCGLTGFCLDSFNATEALLRVLCFTHNLVQLFQDGLGLRKADRPWRVGPRYAMETLRPTSLAPPVWEREAAKPSSACLQHRIGETNFIKHWRTSCPIPLTAEQHREPGPSSPVTHPHFLSDLGSTAEYGFSP